MDKFKDPLVKMEKAYPFHRMLIDKFQAKVFEIGKEKFTINEIRDKLPGSLWENALLPGQKTVDLLLALPGTEPDEEEVLDSVLDRNSFLLLSILWCSGDSKAKADALF